MNQNRLKTINALNWGKTVYNSSTWMLLHISNCSKFHKTSVAPNCSIIATDKIVNFFSFMAPHMCDKFFHGIEVFTTQVT